MSAPDTLALLADDALDGSGSGDRPVWRGPGEISGIVTVDNDDEDGRRDQEEDEGSGSGHGPTFTGQLTILLNFYEKDCRFSLNLSKYFCWFDSKSS